MSTRHVELLSRALWSPEMDIDLSLRRTVRCDQLRRDLLYLVENRDTVALILLVLETFAGLYRANLLGQATLCDLSERCARLPSHLLSMSPAQIILVDRSSAEMGEAMDLVELLGNWRGDLSDAALKLHAPATAPLAAGYAVVPRLSAAVCG